MYLTYHIFVVPYHYTSFPLAIVSHYINSQFGADAAIQYQNAVYSNQDTFSVDNTQDLTTDELY